MADISYTIRKSKRAKSLRVTVSHRGVFVTVPYRLPLRHAEHFLKSRIDWVQKALCRLSPKQPSPWTGTAAEYHRYRARAKKLVTERVKHWAGAHGFSYRRISIKNHRSKWGSCSKTSNLNFNYRLIFLPPELVDYVVVHELCHLRHLNHSKKFWQVARSVLPDVIELRRRMRQYHL